MLMTPRSLLLVIALVALRRGGPWATTRPGRASSPPAWPSSPPPSSSRREMRCLVWLALTVLAVLIAWGAGDAAAGTLSAASP